MSWAELKGSNECIASFRFISFITFHRFDSIQFNSFITSFQYNSLIASFSFNSIKEKEAINELNWIEMKRWMSWIELNWIEMGESNEWTESKGSNELNRNEMKRKEATHSLLSFDSTQLISLLPFSSTDLKSLKTLDRDQDRCWLHWWLKLQLQNSIQFLPNFAKK